MECLAGVLFFDTSVCYSSSDGCLWILNRFLSSDADKLLASVMMKGGWQWIFSLKLKSKESNR